MIKLEAESARKHDDLPMDSVTQANPLVQPQIFYTGKLNAGYSQAIGNSHLRSISLVGDLVARSEQRRLTILGRCVYGDNAGSSSLVMLGEPFKLAHFITKRFFWYGSVYGVPRATPIGRSPARQNRQSVLAYAGRCVRRHP